MDNTTTDFGYQQVALNAKPKLVDAVFDSVAHKYDLMNDLMSFGIHRLWKKIAVQHCALRPGQSVLDVAGGSGDLSLAIAQQLKNSGAVFLTDINSNMLKLGRDKLINHAQVQNVYYLQADAQNLPFATNSYDCVSIGFGLRNVANKQLALNEMYRVLKPGGRLVILEFSKPLNQRLSAAYDTYSFKVLPVLGKLFANDAASYQYLAESIRMHPDQEQLKTMLQAANFASCSYQNLLGGICAIHKGFKL